MSADTVALFAIIGASFVLGYLTRGWVAYGRGRRALTYDRVDIYSAAACLLLLPREQAKRLMLRAAYSASSPREYKAELLRQLLFKFAGGDVADQALALQRRIVAEFMARAQELEDQLREHAGIYNPPASV